MTKIALISDTHGFIDTKALDHLRDVDEIWHAGDIGDHAVMEALPQDITLRAVYGNIDDHTVRQQYPETLFFEVGGIKVLMLHIGGSPPSYAKGVKNKIRDLEPDLFVCGHSHICKVSFDQELNCLYMNPGAIGMQGFHRVRTMLKFDLADGKTKNLRVVELERRAK